MIREQFVKRCARHGGYREGDFESLFLVMPKDDGWVAHRMVENRDFRYFGCSSGKITCEYTAKEAVL